MPRSTTWLQLSATKDSASMLLRKTNFFLNCKMKITLVVEKTLIATHYFIDYMSNMTSIIQISIPLHTDMSSWHFFYTAWILDCFSRHPRHIRGVDKRLSGLNVQTMETELWTCLYILEMAFWYLKLFQFNLELNVKQVLTISKRSSIQGLQSFCCTKSL